MLARREAPGRAARDLLEPRGRARDVAGVARARGQRPQQRGGLGRAARGRERRRAPRILGRQRARPARGQRGERRFAEGRDADAPVAVRGGLERAVGASRRTQPAARARGPAPSSLPASRSAGAVGARERDGDGGPSGFRFERREIPGQDRVEIGARRRQRPRGLARRRRPRPRVRPRRAGARARRRAPRGRATIHERRDGAAGRLLAAERPRQERRDVDGRERLQDEVLREGAVDRRTGRRDEQDAPGRCRSRQDGGERVGRRALGQQHGERTRGAPALERLVERGEAPLQRATRVAVVARGEVRSREPDERLEGLEVAAPDLDVGEDSGGGGDGDLARDRIDQRASARAGRPDDGHDRAGRGAVGEPLERASQGLSLGGASDDETVERIALGVRHAEIHLDGRVTPGASARDLAQELARARRPLARIGRQQPLDDAIPRLGQAGAHRREGRRAAREHALDRGEPRAERSRARPRREERRAQPEEIARGRARARERLGGGEAQRPARGARARARRAREPEVEQHGPSRGVEPHVGRTDVAVDDAAAVQVRERVGERERGALEGAAPLALVSDRSEAVELGTGHELADDERAAVRRAADVAHAHHARVADAEQLAELVGCRRAGLAGEQLDDDGFARARVARGERLGARAPPERAAHDVPAVQRGGRTLR